jgi:hypothetical protein
MHHFEIGRLLGLSGEARTRERIDHEERRHGYIPARSGRSMIFGLHFAFAKSPSGDFIKDCIAFAT